MPGGWGEPAGPSSDRVSQREQLHTLQITERQRTLMLAAMYSFKGTRGRELAPLIEELEGMAGG